MTAAFSIALVAVLLTLVAIGYVYWYVRIRERTDLLPLSPFARQPDPVTMAATAAMAQRCDECQKEVTVWHAYSDGGIRCAEHRR